MKKLPLAFLVALATGVIIAAVYRLFMAIVEEAQHLLWFDIANTDDNKLLAIPMAVVGGLLLAGCLKIAHDKGHQEAGHTIDSFLEFKDVRTMWVVRMLLIGAVSLIAGASLGPEAILLPVSYGIGYLIAKRLRLPNPQVFGLAAIVALLAAFFNSAAAGLLPIGFALAAKRKDVKTAVLILALSSAAALASIGMLRLLGQQEGIVKQLVIGELTINPVLLVAAVGISAVAALVPFLVTAVIPPLSKLFDKLPEQWWLRGLIAGAGIGFMYFLLGPISFFSGHEGIGELLKNNSEYTSLQLAGLAIGKLLVTAWSVATIYRGGIIFPQLLIAMSLALLFSGAIPDSSWLLTILTAAFFGVFAGSMGSLFIAAAFVLSVFGTSVWPLALAAAAGASIIKIVLKKYFADNSAV